MLRVRVQLLVTSEIVATRERLVTQRASIFTRLVHLTMSARVSLEVFGITESSLACCAVVLVSSDGIMDDLMVTGLDVSNPLRRRAKQHSNTDRKVDLVAKVFSQCLQSNVSRTCSAVPKAVFTLAF